MQNCEKKVWILKWLFHKSEKKIRFVSLYLAIQTFFSEFWYINSQFWEKQIPFSKSYIFYLYYFRLFHGKNKASINNRHKCMRRINHVAPILWDFDATHQVYTYPAQSAVSCSFHQRTPYWWPLSVEKAWERGETCRRDKEIETLCFWNKFAQTSQTACISETIKTFMCAC